MPQVDSVVYKKNCLIFESKNSIPPISQFNFVIQSLECNIANNIVTSVYFWIFGLKFIIQKKKQKLYKKQCIS